MLFHVINFHDLLGRPCARVNTESQCRCVERNILEAEGWRITLDQLETTTEHIKQLSSKGGFAITHVAKLERVDGHTFSEKDAIEFLDICSHCLSFSRGLRIPLILYVGYDNHDKRVWEFWSSRRGLTWQYVSSWFPKPNSGSLAKVFPGFCDWWRNWEDVAMVTLHWYLESNINAGGLKGSIVLTQVVLELVAWTLLVEKESIISREGFDKLPASDKIRLLLAQLGIQNKLPPDRSQASSTWIGQEFSDPPNHLDNLVKQATQSNPKWVDGCHAITELRNGIVHPKRLAKVLEADSKAIFEVKFLGLWYLELVLLALMNYDGSYINRCVIPHESAELVPWKTTLS